MVNLLRIRTQAPTEKPKKICGKCNERECDGYICGPCNSKRSLLSQMFGKWPIQPFTELPKELQAEIWKSGCKSKPALHSVLVAKVSQHRIHCERNKRSGKFLPLGCYTALGYNAEKIEKNCAHKYDDDLEEEVYRLNVEEIIDEKVTQEVSKVVYNLRSKTLRGRMSHLASPTPKSKKKRSRSDSLQSSSSSKRKKSRSSSKSSGSSSSSEKELSKEEIAKKKKLDLIRAKKEALQKKQQEAAEKKKEAIRKKEQALLEKRAILAAAADRKAAEKEARVHVCMRPVMGTTPLLSSYAARR